MYIYLKVFSKRFNPKRFTGENKETKRFAVFMIFNIIIISSIIILSFINRF